MKHTKNILKSLLITVMALSLLSVSCSKDEGGTKNPVNPDTPITIDAKMLDSIVQALAKKFTLDGATIIYNNFTSVSGKGSMSAEVSKDVSSKIKTELEKAFTDDTNPNAKATCAVTLTATEKTAKITVTITLKGNNTFASGVSPAYTKEGEKAVKTEITITADKKWNNQN